MKQRTMTAAQVLAEVNKSKLEKTIQQESVEQLEALGYRALVTNLGMRKDVAEFLKAKRVANPKAKRIGVVVATPGIPDLFITADWWPVAAYCAIELKKHDGRLSDAQAKLHEAGRSYVCRTAQEVLNVVIDFEKANNLRKNR